MPCCHFDTENLLHLFQVSRLVIIHEEGEAGHEMPDLSRPVQAVSTAVTNLVKVRILSLRLVNLITLICHFNVH